MTDKVREELIMLLLDSEILCNNCGENAPTYCAEAIADYLMAHDVGFVTDNNDGHKSPKCQNGTLGETLGIGKDTNVPRWIPVTERLPTWADGNKYGGILAVRRGHELSDFYHLNDVKENPDEFTHWMPLPQPPKDGE